MLSIAPKPRCVRRCPVADHTRQYGPWHIERYLINRRGEEVTESERGDLIVKVRVVDEHGNRVADCHTRNALVIASAPDLLAALKRFASDTPCVISDGGIWCSEHMSQVPCCVAAARAAIKKAEGGSV